MAESRKFWGWGLLVAGGLLIAGTQPIRASEGQWLLKNVAGGESRCFGLSVLVETTYHLVVTCRGLIYPPEPPEVQRYILWAEGGELRRPKRLGEIKRGKLWARTSKRFSRLVVTAERATPAKPTGPTILTANLEPINFRLTPTPTTTISPTPVLPVATDEAKTATEPARGFLRTTAGKVIVIAVSGFLIFAIIVVIFSRRA